MKKLSLFVAILICASCTTSKLYTFGQYQEKYLGSYILSGKTFEAQADIKSVIERIVKGKKSNPTFTCIFYKDGLLVYTKKCRIKKLNRFLEPLNNAKYFNY